MTGTRAVFVSVLQLLLFVGDSGGIVSADAVYSWVNISEVKNLPCCRPLPSEKIGDPPNVQSFCNDVKSLCSSGDASFPRAADACPDALQACDGFTFVDLMFNPSFASEKLSAVISEVQTLSNLIFLERYPEHGSGTCKGTLQSNYETIDIDDLATDCLDANCTGCRVFLTGQQHCCIDQTASIATADLCDAMRVMCNSMEGGCPELVAESGQDGSDSDGSGTSGSSSTEVVCAKDDYTLWSQATEVMTRYAREAPPPRRGRTACIYDAKNLIGMTTIYGAEECVIRASVTPSALPSPSPSPSTSVTPSVTASVARSTPLGTGADVVAPVAIGLGLLLSMVVCVAKRELIRDALGLRQRHHDLAESDDEDQAAAEGDDGVRKNTDGSLLRGPTLSGNAAAFPVGPHLSQLDGSSFNQSLNSSAGSGNGIHPLHRSNSPSGRSLYGGSSRSFRPPSRAASMGAAAIATQQRAGLRPASFHVDGRHGWQSSSASLRPASFMVDRHSQIPPRHLQRRPASVNAGTVASVHGRARGSFNNRRFLHHQQPQQRRPASFHVGGRARKAGPSPSTSFPSRGAPHRFGPPSDGNGVELSPIYPPSMRHGHGRHRASPQTSPGNQRSRHDDRNRLHPQHRQHRHDYPGGPEQDETTFITGYDKLKHEKWRPQSYDPMSMDIFGMRSRQVYEGGRHHDRRHGSGSSGGHDGNLIQSSARSTRVFDMVSIPDEGGRVATRGKTKSVPRLSRSMSPSHGKTLMRESFDLANVQGVSGRSVASSSRGENSGRINDFDSQSFDDNDSRTGTRRHRRRSRSRSRNRIDAGRSRGRSRSGSRSSIDFEHNHQWSVGSELKIARGPNPGYTGSGTEQIHRQNPRPLRRSRNDHSSHNHHRGGGRRARHRSRSHSIGSSSHFSPVPEASAVSGASPTLPGIRLIPPSMDLGYLAAQQGFHGKNRVSEMLANGRFPASSTGPASVLDQVFAQGGLSRPHSSSAHSISSAPPLHRDRRHGRASPLPMAPGQHLGGEVSRDGSETDGRVKRKMRRPRSAVSQHGRRRPRSQTSGVLRTASFGSTTSSSIRSTSSQRRQHQPRGSALSYDEDRPINGNNGHRVRDRISEFPDKNRSVGRGPGEPRLSSRSPLPGAPPGGQQLRGRGSRDNRHRHANVHTQRSNRLSGNLRAKTFAVMSDNHNSGSIPRPNSAHSFTSSLGSSLPPPPVLHSRDVAAWNDNSSDAAPVKLRHPVAQSALNGGEGSTRVTPILRPTPRGLQAVSDHLSNQHNVRRPKSEMGSDYGGRSGVDEVAGDDFSVSGTGQAANTQVKAKPPTQTRRGAPSGGSFSRPGERRGMRDRNITDRAGQGAFRRAGPMVAARMRRGSGGSDTHNTSKSPQGTNNDENSSLSRAGSFSDTSSVSDLESARRTKRSDTVTRFRNLLDKSGKHPPKLDLLGTGSSRKHARVDDSSNNNDDVDIGDGGNDGGKRDRDDSDELSATMIDDIDHYDKNPEVKVDDMNEDGGDAYDESNVSIGSDGSESSKDTGLKTTRSVHSVASALWGVDTQGDAISFALADHQDLSKDEVEKGTSHDHLNDNGAGDVVEALGDDSTDRGTDEGDDGIATSSIANLSTATWVKRSDGDMKADDDNAHDADVGDTDSWDEASGQDSMQSVASF